VEGSAQDRSAQSEGRRHPGSPVGKVIAAVAPENKDGLVAALRDAGYREDEMDIVTVDHLEDLESPIDRAGFPGLVNRFLFSLGGELDELERMRQELSIGHILVGVPAANQEVMQRIVVIMREHGGHGITYFGRWTITDLEG
jgi:hypothetical protein